MKRLTDVVSGGLFWWNFYFIVL